MSVNPAPWEGLPRLLCRRVALARPHRLKASGKQPDGSVDRLNSFGVGSKPGISPDRGVGEAFRSRTTRTVALATELSIV